MDCLYAFLASSLVFGLMIYGLHLMVQCDYEKDYNHVLRERDRLGHLLDRANRSMSDTVDKLKVVTKERDELQKQLTDIKNLIQ